MGQLGGATTAPPTTATATMSINLTNGSNSTLVDYQMVSLCEGRGCVRGWVCEGSVCVGEGLLGERVCEEMDAREESTCAG